MNAVDDAVECVRKDVSRASELQFQASQTLNDRVSELDEKLFAFDKELLRLKLALPSAIAAQMATPFGDQSKFTVNGKGSVKLPTGGMVFQQKLQELSMEIAAV